MLYEFATKEELIATRGKESGHDIHESGDYDSLADAIDIATRCAKSEAVYIPHLYRGGWVIRGFGFSTERIGKFIPAELAGDPLTV